MLRRVAVSSFLLIAFLSLCSVAAIAQSVAPDFVLPVVTSNGLTGQTVTLSSFRGSVVLLEFMEPWCPHCQKVASVLSNLNQRYQPLNVVFLTVSGPWNGASANDAAGFIREYGSSWTYSFDSSGAVFNSYGVNGTPTFVIVGRDGSIVTKLVGEQTESTLASAITQAL
jgi:cytochrome c-type biogenesis protein